MVFDTFCAIAGANPPAPLEGLVITFPIFDEWMDDHVRSFVEYVKSDGCKSLMHFEDHPSSNYEVAVFELGDEEGDMISIERFAARAAAFNAETESERMLRVQGEGILSENGERSDVDEVEQ